MVCKRSRHILIWIGIVILIAGRVNVHATEVDSYTFTEFIREDATSEINQEINQLIESALDEANREGVREPEELYSIIHKYLGGFIITRLEEILEEKDDGRILRIDIRDSIYSGMWALWAPSLMLSQKIGGVFKIGEFIVGTDKLGHFISQGYTYFKTGCLKDEGIEKAMLYGINSESTYFGFAATGVFSYGDLVANFQGMRFWNDLLRRHPDILGARQTPYLKEINGLWTLVTPVDIRRYIDAGWDERINQNIFRNRLIEVEVNTKIAQATASGSPFGIKTVREQINVLNRKYGVYSPYLINGGNLQKEHIEELRQKLKLTLKFRAGRGNAG
jgi:hypothetical protein